MRILVISNLYPPYYVGGYELGCRDVVEGLKARGHDVKVLTSTYKVGTAQQDGAVYRWLEADLEWVRPLKFHEYCFKLLKKEIINQRAFKRLCSVFKPNVVYMWNLTHVSLSLALMAQQAGFSVHYFVFDNWLSRWDSDPWYSLWNRQPRRVTSRLGKQSLRPILSVAGLVVPSNSLDLRHVQFASLYLKQFALQAGKPVGEAKVIHWGVDANQYSYDKSVPHNPKQLLYVGQIVRHKGVHTAIQALKVIVQQPGYESATLTIVGGTIVPDYEAYVRGLVYSLGLESRVLFTGLIRRESLPPIYQEHDILIFPSVWDEPFGITLLEAMSSGLAVVGTDNGGSRDILEDEVNALVFPKEDTGACAMQVLRLMEDSELFERIRKHGRRMVEEKFRFESMMDKIERSLNEAIA